MAPSNPLKKDQNKAFSSQNPPTQLHNDQFKQAVLDAIPEQIAVLNSEAQIVEANAAWMNLAGTPLGAMNPVDKKSNYLEMCRISPNHNPGEIRHVIEGIRSVLYRSVRSFVAEYRRINRREGDRWFMINVTPLAGGGAVLVHEDITERKVLEREFINISEYERRRIGKDLHDGLCQVLGGMMLTTAVIAASLKRKDSPEAEEVTALVEIARDATNQARELSRSLHPVELDAEGLGAALQELAAHANTHVDCVFTCQKEIQIYDTNTALSLYRIAQEALSNALHHSNAKKIILSLSMRRRHLILKIEDHGGDIGKKTYANTGMGIQMMRYRASAMGARLQIRNLAGQGTRVSCIVPSPPRNRHFY